MTHIPEPPGKRIVHKGMGVPTFLYGTAWKEEGTEALVYEAIKAGFLGIDTANQRCHYYEEGVGKAIRQVLEERLLSRSELFLQSKFTFASSQDHRLPYEPTADYASQVQQSLVSSLRHLHTDYLDSYILHGPASRLGLTDADWEVWQTMESLQQSGLVRLLGVSNIDYDQLASLLRGSAIKPAFVQNRCYAHSQWDAKIRGLCQANDIIYQGFSLLTANAVALQNIQVLPIIRRLNCSLPQLVFRFALQLGMIPLTGTSDHQHMHDDLACYGLPELTAAEMAVLLHITSSQP